MKSDTSNFSTPDLDSRHNGVPKILCIVLAVVCAALVLACGWLAHSLHKEQERLQAEQSHREALELSGENVIRRATEILDEIDTENIEDLKSQGGGLYFKYTDLFQQFVDQTWNYTISCISGDDNE